MKNNFRKTKIICTIGPATESVEMLEKIIEAGMDVARLNFSHGSHENHARAIKNIRNAAKKIGRNVGILQDLSGPKIRLGKIRDEPRLLVHGEKIILFPGEEPKGEMIPVNYPHLAEDLEEGSQILLADGFVELTVDKIDGANLHCTVENEGEISSHKGVNLPLSKLRIEAFTDKDRKDLTFGLSAGVDYVAMSFVRSVDDLRPLKKMIAESDNPPLLLAKMEKPEAIDELDNILSFVDGLMVARGDLGVEMKIAELPIVQKKIISATRRAAKPVITATQMLRSMIDNPRPSRAEATDCANAILDGTSAVMLSEETAVGSYPIEAVRVLDNIARATEKHIDSGRLIAEEDADSLSHVEAAITRAVAILAKRLSAKCIVVTTFSGRTARKMGRFRLDIPILGITSQPATISKMSILWGVIPLLEEEMKKPTELSTLAIDYTKKHGIAEPGDLIILTSGYPSLSEGGTDMVKVITVT